MWVRVLLSGTPMRSPTCVAKTEVACHRLLRQKLFQISQLARRATHLQMSIFNNGNPGRVIATVFERSKAPHDDGDRVSWTDVAKNSAHGSEDIKETRRQCGHYFGLHSDLACPILRSLTQKFTPRD